MNMDKKMRKVVWGVALAVVIGLSLYTRIKVAGGAEQTTQQKPQEQTETALVIQEQPEQPVSPSVAQAEPSAEKPAAQDVAAQAAALIDEDGSYNSKDDVSLYIYTYSRLPKNYITKREAQALGWSGGSLEPYAPGKSIGGDRFGNREGVLPKQSGRSYKECDIDTLGKASRGAKRIVFSNDGLIYYTEDHYASFEKLYGDE